MAGPNCVDVVLFHHREVLSHQCLGDHFARSFAVVVAINAPNQHGLTVDQELPIFDLDVPKTDL